MTSGWTGEAYEGIPAGRVGPIRTMQPQPTPLGQGQIQGVNYFLMRGQGYAAGGPLDDPTLFRDHSTSSALSAGCMATEKHMGCSPVPPMDHCRTLVCPSLATAFAGSCIGPEGPVAPLRA